MPLLPATCPLPQPPRLARARPWLEERPRGTLLEMAAPAATADALDATLAVEEARLAQAAANGDGDAFATLYERYERRAYNLAYRLTTSEDDAADAVQDAFVNVLRRLPKLEGRELAFGSYIFTATRNASYNLMQKRKRAQPSEAIPEEAVPVGAAAGGAAAGDPGDDPDRKLLLEAHQEEIRAANERLPERQREALALCELEELSYDEIAAIMDMNRNSVAQLISRARIKLRDELRGETLASIAVSSPDCERALPLIALRDDGQLDDGDGAWLDGHLSGCHTCRLGVEAMQEAGASYRAWAPVAAVPWLFEETMAKAAAATGADWSETIAERSARHDPAGIQPGMPSLYRALVPVADGRRRRRRIFAAAGLGAAALLAVVATVAGRDDPPTPAEPAAQPVETVVEPAPRAEPAAKRKAPKTKKEGGAARPTQTGGATADPAAPESTPPAVLGDDGAPAAQPRSRTRTSDPRARTQDPAVRLPPVSEPDPPPVEPPPTVEEPPPTEPPPEPPGREDPTPPTSTTPIR